MEQITSEPLGIKEAIDQLNNQSSSATTPTAIDMEFARPIPMTNITEESKDGTNDAFAENGDMMNHPIDFG